MKPRLIGLTGNIGCGKSTVARMLAKFPDVVTYETDYIWKELLASTVCRLFVQDLIGAESFIDDRPRLDFIAQQIFQDKEKSRLSVSFFKSQVMNEIRSRMQTSPKPIHIVESAMLYESGAYTECCEVIVTVCDPEEQMRRVLTRRIPDRPSLTREEFDERLRTQWVQADKVTLGTHVIDTHCSLPELEERVRELHDQLLEVS